MTPEAGLREGAERDERGGLRGSAGRTPRTDGRGGLRGSAERTPRTDGRGDAARLFVGTYTEGTGSEGIYTLAFDAKARRLAVERTTRTLANPSFLVPWGQLVCAAHELPDRGCMATYAVRADGSLALVDARATSDDAGTCFVAVHPAGRALYGANYQSGSIGCCPLGRGGSLGAPFPSVHHGGHGANPERQEAPHVHTLGFVPGTSHLVAVDLGIDALTRYRTMETGALALPPLAVERVPAGSGPRIMAYHPRLPLAAVVDELANDVLVFHIGEAAAAWTLLGRWNLLGRPEEDGASPETEATAPSEAEAAAQAAVVGRPTRAGHPTGPAGGASGHDELSPARRTNLAAHGAFAPDGRRLYVSVRGSDLMVVFDLDREGHATKRSAFPSGGRGPRHFSLSPSGELLAVANQDSGTVALFRLDGEDAPVEVAHAEVPQASCVVWEPQA